MATANIKITALSDITSANMTYQDLVAVVDMNGTPETKKANIQLVGNLILNSAGGSYFPAAAQAVLAQSVTNAAQPNITSTGTLTSLAVTGNVVAGNMQTGAMTATYFVGDGANLTNLPAGIPAGDGGNLSNLAGANVTGEVAFAAVANSIAVANVSGIGNVALVNLDGNVSNILHGDGTWSADATDYSNANVTSLLAAFGSNTISTTGLITGDGGGLSNVPYANVTGTPTLGNVSTVNLDGNASNILHGDGTWSADATDYSNANVVSLLAAFGSNTITTTGLVTADLGGGSNIIGANVTGEVSFAATANAVAYANVSGTPTLGNIASTNYDGNASNVLHGDGTWSADATDYSNANVVSLLAAFGSNTISTTGNVGVGTLSGSNGAAFLSTADNQFVVERDNGTSFRFKGNDFAGNVIQTYAGIFYNDVYGNASATKTRLVIGSNEDASFELQTSNEMRISAVDNSTGGGKVRIASGDGKGSPYAIEFHPGTQAEVDNLVAKIDVGGLEVTGNISGTGLITGDAGGLSNVIGANVTGEVSFAATANAVAGANVSGEVSFAATANAVAVGNVSGIGNVATVNLDGNVSNVLRGDGSFGADANSSYGDSNVVSLLGSFGSNTITTTGNVSGGNFLASGEANVYSLFVDAGGANIQGNVQINGDIANVAYVNASGNINANNFIALSNFDGLNLSVTGTATAGQFIGDGGGLSNLAVANVTGLGNIATTNFDGNAANYLDGTGSWGAITLSGDGGNISNIVGANVSGEVSFAATANAVALGNVSGAGNIASINLDGNVSNVLRGDGSFAADANSAYGDSNVVTLLGSFGSNAIVTTGNISAGNVNSNVNGFSIGYLEIPQVALTADDTIALEDSGKHFHSNTAGNITLTIPTNATVAFPVGTAISIVEEAAGNILVNAAAGVNLYLAGNSTAANRVLGTYGMATLMKVGTDTWFINGSGIA